MDGGNKEIEAVAETKQDASEVNNIKLEETEIQEKKETNIEPCCSNIEELERLFADRYTEVNEGYKKICEGFDPVIVVYPWASRPKRVFDHSRPNYDRGGWRGHRGNQRGNWRGGRGDYNRNGQGYNGGKRKWDDNNQDSRSNGRVHYPGRQY